MQLDQLLTPYRFYTLYLCARGYLRVACCSYLTVDLPAFHGLDRDQAISTRAVHFHVLE